jgi:GTP cyclohydrolase I
MNSANKTKPANELLGSNGRENAITEVMNHQPEAVYDMETIEAAVRAILSSVGEDPAREGLERTPYRVAKMYEEILAGYHIDPVALVNDALFDVEYDEMIIVKDIEFFSLCEHHMLPFYGRAHVAYIPSDKIIGLSKIPRIVDMFSRRLQVQERMTRQIAELLDEILHPLGVAVIVEGAHMCSMMRGVKKEHPRMVTSTMLGSFKKKPNDSQ